MREITAPDGYEIAEDVTFTLKDTMEVQKVEMKDARTPEKTTEKTNAPKTGDFGNGTGYTGLAALAAGLMLLLGIKKKRKEEDGEE